MYEYDDEVEVALAEIEAIDRRIEQLTARVTRIDELIGICKATLAEEVKDNGEGEQEEADRP